MNELSLYSFEGEPWFAQLTDAGRRTVRERCAAIERILKARPRGRAIAREAARLCLSTSAIRAWVTAYKKSGGDPQSQINWANEPHDEAVMPEAFIEFWKSLVEENQRCAKPAWRKMRDLYWAGATEYLPHKGEPIPLWPGYAERPAPSPSSRDGLPRGWSYENLTRRENFSTQVELLMARQGPIAASELLEQVFTTRVGLKPGQFYVFDDRWLDGKSIFYPAARKPIRSVELSGGDVASCKTIAWGLLPMVDNDEGKQQRLKERDMRLLLAYVICLVGFHRDGVTLLVEHGTAAISRELELLLCVMSGGTVVNGEITVPGLIRVKRSGIKGGKSFAGGFPSLSTGNYRFKAMWESMHNLKHNELADIPGQVGKNSRLETVEADHGMDAEARLILEAASELDPKLAQLLIEGTGYPTFEQLVRLNGAALRRIDNYTDHRLQGWKDAGNLTSEFRLTFEGDKWQPMEKLLTYPDAQRAAIQAWLDETEWATRSRQLSRREVWERGEKDLITLPLHCMPEILGPDLAYKTPEGNDPTVQPNSTFVFRKKGEDDQIYSAVARTPEGGNERLLVGLAYRVWINPYDPSILFVSHAQGGFIGICQLRTRIDRHDDEAFKRAAGEAAAVQADVLAPFYRRALKKNRALRKQRVRNVALIESGGPTDTEIEDYETPNFGAMNGK